jgi:hypothetical protein
MADERNPKVSQRYRELGRDEPSRKLDQAILAAAHRAADTPHAPLVTPAGRHRWYFSLGAAAILVLAVAVTVHVERERPDPEAGAAAPVPSAPKEDFYYKKEAPPVMEQRRDTERAAPRKQVSPPKSPPTFAPDPKPQAQEAPRELARDAAPAAPASPAQDAVRDRVRSEPEVRRETGIMGIESTPAPVAKPAPQPQAAPAQSRVLQGSAVFAYIESPERFLDRIAELRKEGRHNEADQALAEFRQRYPDYRIPEEMLKKVERKK